MVRAKASGITLNDADAAIVKGMLERGDRQHDIASWFGVNGGRIAEISTGSTFAHVDAVHANLPPSGPYLSGRGSQKVVEALRRMKSEVSELLDEIDDLISEASPE